MSNEYQELKWESLFYCDQWEECYKCAKNEGMINSDGLLTICNMGFQGGPSCRLRHATQHTINLVQSTNRTYRNNEAVTVLSNEGVQMAECEYNRRWRVPYARIARLRMHLVNEIINKK